ncbi:MAG: TetR/AcrR family transcriptional regulator [Gammaproteobacteria bacterium]
MPTPQKSTYHHGDLRNALIREAVTVIGEQGLEGVTMRRLSERIGVSRTAAYRHFADKQMLLRAVAEEGFLRFRKALRAGRERYPDDPRLAFRAMGSAYLRFALDHPTYYRLMFYDTLPPEEPPGSLEAAAEAAFTELVEALRALHGPEGESTEALGREAIFVWSAVHGFATLVADKKLPKALLDDSLQSDLLNRILVSVSPLSHSRVE